MERVIDSESHEQFLYLPIHSGFLETLLRSSNRRWQAALREDRGRPDSNYHQRGNRSNCHRVTSHNTIISFLITHLKTTLFSIYIPPFLLHI